MRGGCCVTFFGVILLGLFTALGFGGLEIVIDVVITMMMQLRPNTDIWRMWTTVPIPIYMKFRLFNITNPEEMATGSKAILQEVGPYVYLEDLEKVDITIDEENDVIRYRQPKTYYFVPEMSNGTEQDEVTFINIIFLAVASIAHEFTDDDFMLTSLNNMLADKGERLTRKAIVKDLIFDGVSIQTYINLFNDDLVKAAAEAAGAELNIPDNIADGKFALLKGLNGTSEEWWDVRSGRMHSQDLGRIITWQNQTSVKFWKGTSEDGCNQINGTDSTIFPPFMTKESQVQVFSSQICRSLTFVFENESSAQGIGTYRFESSPNNFKSPQSYPPNWCFCPNLKNETGSCEREGVMDIRSCLGGAPLIISSPHFLNADAWMVEAVEGLSPDPAKHKMIIDFHALSGSPVEAFARVQFSIELIPYPAMPSFEEVQRAVIPFIWAEEHATLDDMNLNMLRALDLLQWIFPYARFVLMGLGGVVILLGLFCCFTGKKSKVDGME